MYVLDDEVTEELLEIILKNYDGNSDFYAKGDYDLFPKYIINNTNKYFSKLEYSDLISNFYLTLSSWSVFLTPQGIRYFDDKEKYLREIETKKANKQSSSKINIENLYTAYSQFGDYNTQTFNTDISIETKYQYIENYIEENGGEDKEELKELFEQVKLLVSEIEASKQIPENKSILNKLSGHLDKHGWFYGAVVNLLGTAVLNVL